MLQLLLLWFAVSSLSLAVAVLSVPLDASATLCESVWYVLTGVRHGTRVPHVVTGATGQWLLPEQLSGCSAASATAAAAATAKCFGCSGTHPASSSAQEGQILLKACTFS